jgi:hypothetical protein
MRPVGRLLIVDACLDKRLASELRKRGRNARGGTDINLPTLDDDLLDAIAALDPEAVLITGDDDMPAEHQIALQRTGITVAIVDPILAAGFSQSAWPHEVVHRWAHRMEEQAQGTIRRYNLANLIWTDRKRRPPKP